MRGRWRTFGDFGRLRLTIERAHEVFRGRNTLPHPGQPVNLLIFDKLELRQRSFFNEDGITHNFSLGVVGDTTPCQPSLLCAGGNRPPGPRQRRIPISQPIWFNLGLGGDR